MVGALRVSPTVLGEGGQLQLRGIVENAGTKETVSIRRPLVPPGIRDESLLEASHFVGPLLSFSEIALRVRCWEGRRRQADFRLDIPVRPRGFYFYPEGFFSQVKLKDELAFDLPETAFAR
jgi:hypothetical protein